MNLIWVEWVKDALAVIGGMFLLFHIVGTVRSKKENNGK